MNAVTKPCGRMATRAGRTVRAPALLVRLHIGMVRGTYLEITICQTTESCRARQPPAPPGRATYQQDTANYCNLPFHRSLATS